MSAMAPLQAAPAKPQATFASAARGVLQRKCTCGLSKSSSDGRNDEFPSPLLQRKLAIGATSDPLEREADRIADQVLAGRAHPAPGGAAPHIQRFAGQPGGETTTAPASVDRVLASSGRPLEPSLRRDMEQRFGHDFSRVRVHSGGVAEQSARDVNATAYTVGHDIVFGAGRFAPETHDGRRLIAHELTHVVQQSVSEGFRIDQAHERRGLSPITPPSALLQRNEDDRPPTPDQLREQARREIGELEKQLDDAVRRADNRLGELGSRAPAPTAPEPQPQPGPYGDPLSDRDRQKARRTPVQPGSKKDIAQRRNRVENELRRVARGGGPHAAEAQGILDDLAQRQKEIRDRVIDRRANYKPYGPKPPPAKPKPKPKPATADKPGAKVDKPPAKAPHVPSSPTGGKVSKEVASEAVEGAARKGKLAGLGGKIGKATLSLIDGLMPDPTDAIALLIKFAESFKAAQEAVRKRNVEKGFAAGWACYVLFPTWERAQTFARTHVEKDVITQIIDAVGIAENAYNEGLVRGFRYGEKHSTSQLDNVRQRALNAVHRSGRTVNGYYLGDGVYQFVRDDVYLFAGALLPATRQVLADSEQRKEAREARERMELEAKKAREDYDAGRAPAGVREW